MPDDEIDPATVLGDSRQGTNFLEDVGEDDIEPLEEKQDRAAEVSTPPPPSLPSPSLASPVSLYQLGITQYSPLRRQISSPLVANHHELGRDEDDGQDEEQDDLTQDSRDVLVQRLGDLIQRVNTGSLSNNGVSTLHSKVDEMESVLSGHRLSPTARMRRSRPVSMNFEPATRDGGIFWGSPSQSWIRLKKETSLPEAVPKPGLSVEEASRIATEAEELNSQLSTLVSNLKARQEESNHIHALLVDRAERAAQRIIFLQGKVHDLEEELRETDSELSYLRLGLKAIEVQCPPDPDDELRQSIENWKSDWAMLKQKRTKRSSDVSVLSTPRKDR